MLDPETRHFDDLWRRKADSSASDGYQVGQNLRVDAALRVLGSGHRMLDVGCGNGLLARQLVGRFAEAHGVDISPRAVELACAAGVVASVVNLGDQPLSYPDRHFDAVTSLSVLQYVRDLEAALRECHRVLVPGGALVVSIPNMRAAWRIYKLAVRGTFPRTSMDVAGIDGGVLHYFCRRDFASLLERSGFRAVSACGIYCMPRALDRAPDAGPLGAIKREFLSGELLFQATA